MVNSGRLSVATVYNTPLSTADAVPLKGSARLGAPVPDAPLRDRQGAGGYLLEHLRGGFEILHVKNGTRPKAPDDVKLTVLGEEFLDQAGHFTQRLDATPGATYLLRPDQHLCARWRR